MIENLFCKTFPNLLLVLVFVSLTTRCVECGACDEDKPCLGRGGCYYIKETVDQTFFSTACVCVKGFTGRWCQYHGSYHRLLFASYLLSAFLLPSFLRFLTFLLARSHFSVYFIHSSLHTCFYPIAEKHSDAITHKRENGKYRNIYVM